MRPFWPDRVWPAPVVLWCALALGHLLATTSPFPADLESPARVLALSLGVGSLLVGIRRSSRERLGFLPPPRAGLPETLLGLASVFVAGVSLGGEADRAAWPLPVHPREIQVEMEGRVLDTTAIDAEIPAIVFEARRIRCGTAETACGARLTLRWRDDTIPPRWILPGLWLRLEGAYRPPEDARNPGASAPGRWLERLGIAGTVAVDPLTISAPPDPPERGADAGALLRDRIARVCAAELSRPVAALTRGMLLGDRSGIAPAIQDSFRNGGTIHILSISGLHVCILAGFLALLARALRLSLALSIVMELAALWAYVALVGAPASALRSALLWTAIRTGRLRGTTVRPFTAWGLAGLALHLLDPASVHDPGFQLSFLAVLGLGAATPLSGAASITPSAMGAPVRKLVGWVRAVWSLFIQSAGASTGTAGLQSRLFGAVPVVGLALNLVIIPLCTLFMAEAILFLGAVAMGLPGPRAAAAGALEASGLLLLELNERGASLARPWITPGLTSAGAIAVSSALLLLAWAAAEAARVGSLTRAAALRWSLVALVGAAVVPLVPPTRSPDVPGLLALDVGQGDATWIRLPGGGSLLVDAGPRDERRDSGAVVIEPALRDEGARPGQPAILSHAHLDHFGGFECLASRGWIGTLWENGSDPRGAWWQALKAALVREGGHIRSPRGDTSWVVSGAHVRLYRGLQDGGENDRSLATRIEWGGVRFLLSGDLEAAGEVAVLPRLGPVEILKAPHHGSRTSSRDDWVATLRPRVVVISCGERNRFGHPDPHVIERYQRAGARVFRTDQEGAIRVTPGSGGAWVSTRRHPAPEFVPYARPGDR